MTLRTYHHGNLKEALISAGLKILSEKGIEGLSLRNVAKQVGVSHTAPYNHFSDKQALLAAISTAGHKELNQVLSEAFEKSKEASPNIILEIAWAYFQFALDNPDKFKLMFSGALEEETEHPIFVESSLKNIELLEEIISYCQNHGQLETGIVELIAMRLWSSVHGFANLIIEDQFPPQYLQGKNLKDLLRETI